MALAKTPEPIIRFLLAPLQIHGTPLPPNLLLIAKLIFIGLVLKGYYYTLPHVFVPFLTIFEIVPDPWFRRACIIAFFTSGTLLLFNRAVRVNCIILGSVFLIAILASKAYYTNAKLFVALIFILIGLCENDRSPVLIWWQLSLMYLGAGVNKIFDPDWRSGRYFEYFLGELHNSPIFNALAQFFPDLVFAAVLCWIVIFSELIAGAGFLVRKFHPYALWVATSVHLGAAVLVGTDFAIFVPAILASYLSMLKWPNHIEIQDNKGNLARIARLIFPASIAKPFITQKETTSDRPFTIQYSGKTFANRTALLRLAMWHPASYALIMIVLTLPYGEWQKTIIQTWGTLGLLLLTLIAITRFTSAARSPKPPHDA